MHVSPSSLNLLKMLDVDKKTLKDGKKERRKNEKRPGKKGPKRKGKEKTGKQSKAKQSKGNEDIGHMPIRGDGLDAQIIGL